MPRRAMTTDAPPTRNGRPGTGWGHPCPVDPAHGRLLAWAGSERWGWFCPNQAHDGDRDHPATRAFFRTSEAESGLTSSDQTSRSSAVSPAAPARVRTTEPGPADDRGAGSLGASTGIATAPRSSVVIQAEISSPPARAADGSVAPEPTDVRGVVPRDASSFLSGGSREPVAAIGPTSRPDLSSHASAEPERRGRAEDQLVPALGSAPAT